MESSSGQRKKLILFCDREIFHRKRYAPAAKEAGNFPCLKMLPVAKWREKFRFLLLVREATILIGSGKKTYIRYWSAGRSVLGKTVPEVLSTVRGRRLRAVLKTEGTVFPNTDRPRPANNVFIIFFRRVLCKQFLC